MRHRTGWIGGIVLLVACAGEATTATRVRTSDAALADRRAGESVERDLATLRRVTARFHDFGAAKAAGWSTMITACMDSATGGMGFHFGNDTLIDGAVAVDKPELLLYEPEAHGRKRLVAVEYIVPLTAWHKADPPRLFGRDFQVNAMFQVWALHAWVWKDNPDGVFANWNPRVNCAHTTDLFTM
ncbi:MAG TPA: hypothetical protein VH277_14610 [Gemmatimonadaceae bacterium]|jgi:hypothetical protein|nr:hypothetical protein [Gemmatimonadaceae bacterium]